MDEHTQLKIIAEMRELIGKLKSDVRWETSMSLLTFSPVLLMVIVLLFAGCSKLHDRLDNIESELRMLKRDLPTRVASEYSVEKLDAKVKESEASIRRSIEAAGSRTQMALDRLAR
jgi:hypothetical protein